jgi:hypothetical protein
MHEPRVAMTPTPCTTALAETPARALMFLRAIATRAPLRALMSEGGFTAEDHAEGWALLTRACEYRARSSSTTERFRAKRAMAEIHDWVTTHFPRLRAALERQHPADAGPMRWVEVATEPGAIARLLAKHRVAPEPARARRTQTASGQLPLPFV